MKRKADIGSNFLERELFLNQLLQQGAFNIEILEHFRRERALQQLAVATQGSLVLDSELPLADNVTIDFGDVG